MHTFSQNPNVRIEGLMGEGPTQEWIVTTPGGVVLFRSRSREDAMSWREDVARLSREDVLALNVAWTRDTPDYIGERTIDSPESRFCHWALRKLGHVSVFAIETKGTTHFSVKANCGQRAEGPTLAAALFGLVNDLGALDRAHKRREAKHEG